MATASALDSEFMQYWSRLSELQKESLLSVAKNFVGNAEKADASELRKQLVEEERASYLRGEGRSYDWDEVKQMARNKEQRNGL